MNYNQSIHLVEQMLLGKQTIQDSYVSLEEMKKEYTLENPIYSVVARLVKSYKSYEEDSRKKNDFIDNLRHFLLIMDVKVQVSKEIFNLVNQYEYGSNFEFLDYGDGYELSCKCRYPTWLKAGNEINEVYQYPAKESQSVVGDGYLYHMTGFKEYTSKGQKYLVDAALNQLEGTTILAALRTGGGKSLVFQMPSFYDQEGVTLVIVPTVSLAIDQQENIKAFYKDKLNARAIHSGVTQGEREIIEKELRDGKVSLIYTSPEVALRSWFKNILYELASEGVLKRFVIDEAHIVDEWGDLFRIDFQMLSVLRKQLLKRTNNKLKTLLVSATLSEEVTEMLSEQFSEGNNLIEIRTDTLRDEILFYYHSCFSVGERMQRFEEILPLLPRPFIVYVGTKRDAEIYYQRIIENGYFRVAQFTGDSAPKQREQMIKDWKNNEIDIIVATSAFGVGVDKKDVRAVVHLYMPPSVDRFYQEVGRGGRDGFPSLSISLISHKEDYSLINNLTSNKVLTVGKIVEKTQDLLAQPVSSEGGDKLVVNTMIRPLIRNEEYTGKIFANWYGYVLLFLYRNGYIDIYDVELLGDSNYNCHIKIKDLSITHCNERLLEKLEEKRNAEREKINYQIEIMKKMFNSTNTMCYGDYFLDVYPDASKACRSCPICRAKHKHSRKSMQHITINAGRPLLLQHMKQVSGEHDSHLLLKENLFEFEGEYNPLYLNEHEIEFDVLIVENRSLVEFNRLQDFRIRIFEYNELLCGDDVILSGVICIVMSMSEQLNSKIFKQMQYNKHSVPTNKYIYIAPKDLTISSQSRKLRNLIEGPTRVLQTGGFQ